MSLSVLIYQLLYWTIISAAHYLFGGWGLFVATVFAFLMTSELRRTDLWLLQVGSVLSAAVINLWWPELSQLLQAEINEAWGWHLAFEPTTLAMIGFGVVWGGFGLSPVVAGVIQAISEGPRYRY